MARIRTIKPEFWTDTIIVRLPIVTRLFYIGLWNIADDYGLLWDEPDRIEMQLFPRDPSFRAEEHLGLLEAAVRLEKYETEDGRTFWKIAHWEQHQKVDHPGKCLFPRESSRKLAIPAETRRTLATKYGCKPGETLDVQCYYCGNPGKVCWFRHYDGSPSAWVAFSGLEIEHFVAEANGGTVEPDNMVLACRNCNRSKGTQSPFDFVSLRTFASTRETSCSEREMEKDREGSGVGVLRAGRGTPTLEKCKELCHLHGGSDAQAEKLFWHYESVGWPSNGMGIRVDAIVKRWLLGDADRQMNSVPVGGSRNGKPPNKRPLLEPWMLQYGEENGLSEEQMMQMDWAPVARARKAKFR